MGRYALPFFLAAAASALAADLEITRAWPSRVYCRPGEAIALEVEVANPTAERRSATLTVELRHGLDARIPLLNQEIALEPGKSFPWRGTWKAEPLLGLELRAALSRDGRVLAEKRGFFTCARSVHQVLLPAAPVEHWFWQFSGRMDREKYPPRAAASVRAMYGNFIEKFAWGPSDLDDLTPDADRWWAGQTGYNESKPNMIAFIKAMREHGIRVVTYGKASGGGPVGFENLRHRPDLAGYTDGRFWGNYDAAALDYLAALGPPREGEQAAVPGKPEEMEKAGYHGAAWFKPFTEGYHWCDVWYSAATPGVAEIGIGELVGSARMLGFDGVRFDGELFATRARRLDGSFNAPEGLDEEAANVAFVRQMKQRCWAARPGYLFGYNAGTDIRWSVPADNTPPSFREKCRDDGLIANEAMAFPGDVPWLDYAARVRREADLVRHYGGHHATYAFNRSGDRLYNFILNFASRSHLMGAYTGGGVATADLNRFVTRFAALLWDDALRAWPDAPKAAEVQAARPLWWAPFAAARPLPGGGAQFILHLINPPEGPTTLAKQKMPAEPARSVTVRWNQAKGFRRALLADLATADAHTLQPERVPRVPRAGERSGERSGDGLLLRLPDIPYWAILVVETDQPAPEPRWEGGPAPSAVKTPTAEDLQLAPATQPQADKPSWRQVLEPENWGGGESTADREKDPDALNGGACHGKPGRPAGAMAYTYAYPRIPGRYNATFRLKVGDNTVDRPVFILHVSHWVSHPIRGVPMLKNPTLTVKASDFKAPNAYQDFTVGFEYPDQGFMGVGCEYVGSTIGVHPKQVDGWWDRVTLQLIEPWTRERLEQHYAGFTPPKGLALRRDETLDLLLVRGLWNRHYRLDQAIARLPGQVNATAAYTTYHPQHDTQLKGFTLDWEPLFAQDVVVFANVETRGLGLGQVRMIGEWVRQGGTLLILGGLVTLGQNWNMARGWDALLPVRLSMPWEIRRCDPPVRIAAPKAGAPLAGIAWDRPPLVLYRHTVDPAEGAEILLTGVGGEPLLVAKRHGRGRVIVFAGTVLGEAPDGQTAFWDSPAWPEFLARVIRWGGVQ